jgi:hypothetical protein
MHTRTELRFRRARAYPALALLAAALAAPAAGEEPASTPPAPPAGAPAAQTLPPPPAPPAAPDNTRRVTYIPESVKAELKDELRRELAEERKKVDVAAIPPASLDWLRRVRFRGDLRFRAEGIMYPSGNGPVFDFNAINQGSPVNYNLQSYVDATNDRFVNVDQNRSRARVRARLGIDADVSDRVLAVVRLATGDNPSPVSTNQTFGGSAGGFAKLQPWFDRLALRFDGTRRSDGAGVIVDVGRFESPFVSTDLVWDEDVNFDGLAVKGIIVAGGARVFATGGVFPLFATPIDFSAQSQQKFRSTDRWLYAGQVGVELRPTDRLGLTLAAAYYDFHGAQGRASSPCDTNVKGLDCDTDTTRPSFAQKGNTYFPLRSPSQEALAAEATNPTTTPEYQYFGLASPFRVVTGTARLRVPVGALEFGADAEYAWNQAFRKSSVAKLAINNFSKCVDNACQNYSGGNQGALGRLSIGSRTFARRWDWSAVFTYRRIESDATVDAFVDSDFGLGGTNLKGYAAVLGMGVADGVFLNARWYSADTVTGSPYSVDVFQLDLLARY